MYLYTKFPRILTLLIYYIGNSDRIIKAYGVAKGPLSHDLTHLFNIMEEDEGVGIVMRYEVVYVVYDIVYCMMMS